MTQTGIPHACPKFITFIIIAFSGYRNHFSCFHDIFTDLIVTVQAKAARLLENVIQVAVWTLQ